LPKHRPWKGRKKAAGSFKTHGFKTKSRGQKAYPRLRFFPEFPVISQAVGKLPQGTTNTNSRFPVGFLDNRSFLFLSLNRPIFYTEVPALVK